MQTQQAIHCRDRCLFEQGALDRQKEEKKEKEDRRSTGMPGFQNVHTLACRQPVFDLLSDKGPARWANELINSPY